jgi:hypothetical protein
MAEDSSLSAVHAKAPRCLLGFFCAMRICFPLVRVLLAIFDWCAAHALELTTVRPFHVATRIEDFPGSKPQLRLKLAAVRMLYSSLVFGKLRLRTPPILFGAKVHHDLPG